MMGHLKKTLRSHHPAFHSFNPFRFHYYGAFLLILGLFVLEGTLQKALALPMSIDTTALAGSDARLDFQLFDGDFTANNSATVSNLLTNGTLQGTVCSVSCIGVPPYTISDTGGFGQFLQDLKLGTSIFFDLNSTANFAGGDPDLLVLNLLDPNSNFTLVDTDLDALAAPVPYQDALLVVALRDGGNILLPTATDPPVGVNVVPEPGTFVLMIAGVPSFLLWRKIHQLLRA